MIVSRTGPLQSDPFSYAHFLEENRKLKSKLNNMEISFEMINNDRTKFLLENKELHEVLLRSVDKLAKVLEVIDAIPDGTSNLGDCIKQELKEILK